MWTNETSSGMMRAGLVTKLLLFLGKRSGTGGYPTKNSMPLPPEIVRLRTIKARPWFLINSRPTANLEGPAFDREGNLYVTFGGPRESVREILKISPDRKSVSVIYRSTTVIPVGIAIHKDGRLFVACITGQILTMNPDGEDLRTFVPQYMAKTLLPNDMVFDDDGNLYFTDFSGSVVDPTGGVYRVEALGGYSTIKQVLGNLARPNGISLSPSKNTLWIGETGRNAILRIDLLSDGLTPKSVDGISYVFYSTGGPAGPDSNKVDSAGNLYQCFNLQGRALVTNRYGVPVANVLLPERSKGLNLVTTNLAFKPGTDEAYIMAAGASGPWIYKFKGLACGQQLYSHE